MLELSDEEFEKIVGEAIDAIPDEYGKNLSNIAFTFSDEPSPQQRKKLKLRCGQTLFGLYEGIPKTARLSNYSGVLPDKITIFKNPILSVSTTIEDVKRQTHRTVWHEVAHHYGLDHDIIHELERKIISPPETT